MGDSEKTLSAAYVSWPTMKNALDQLSQGIPNRVDRSVFPGMAWSVQAQLFLGMRFLGLIGPEGEPKPALEKLVSGDEKQRKEKLREIIEQCYSDLIALDLMKVTPDQLEEKIGEFYKVGGDTRNKAARFFIGAAEYTGIKFSPLLGKKTRGGGIARKKKYAKKSSDGESLAASESSNPGALTNQQHSPGTSKTVELRSGGTLTLSASLDLFSLDDEDQKFVFALIGQLKEYAKKVSTNGNVEPVEKSSA